MERRLHAVAENLHLAYSETRLTKSDAFAAQMRELTRCDAGKDKRRLPGVRQLCAGIRPDHEVEFIVVCPICGQMFDCRNLIHVDHHSSETHLPRLR